MSTFEGRQITQLICPKSSKTAAEATGTETVGNEAEGEGDAGGRETTETGFDMRERGEAFMCVSLEVKNMMGVEDALKKMTEKESIEGYAWDEQVWTVWRPKLSLVACTSGIFSNPEYCQLPRWD